jgi:type IV pilus assembly protein PilB
VQNNSIGEQRGDGESSRQSVPPAKKLMGQLLIDAGLIDADQLQAALAQQQSTGKKLGDTLEELGFMKRPDFERFISGQPGVASIDLVHYEIPREVLKTIPREFAIANQVFPIDKLGKLLTVGMACPLDSKSIQELQELTGLRVKALLCSMDDILACIKQYYQTELNTYEVDERSLLRRGGELPPPHKRAPQ